MRLVLFTGMLLTGTLFAEWMDFGLEGIDHAMVTVLESTPGGMVIEVEVPGIGIEPFEKDGTVYSMLNIPGTSITALEPGYPQFPKLGFLAALPSNPSVVCTVEQVNTVELGEHIPYPMQPIPFDNAPDAPWTLVSEAYTTGAYPVAQAEFAVDGTLRGVTVGRFVINPVSWDPESGMLTACTRMRIRIDFGGSVTVDPRLYSRFFVPTFRDAFINAGVLGEPARTVLSDLPGPVVARTYEEAMDIDGADLLILAGDDFVDTMMDTYLEAKYEQGYVTAVVAAGSWSYTQIASYIQTAYDTWTLPPSFLLFVGDGPQLTAYNQQYGWGDNRYACVDGSDYIADVFHGRFCSSTDFYPSIEQKQLKWQFDPLMDASFWNNLLCAGMLQTNGGSTATRWFLYTCETVHDTYEDIYGKTAHRVYITDASGGPPYYYRPDLPSHGEMVPTEITFDGTTNDIINTINDGVFLIQHRDHGSVTGWADPPFYNSNLPSLTNGEKTPVVFSFNCLTGNFQSNTCFAESFARMDGGAVSVIAACESSYSYFNDYIVYGCYMSFNDDFVSPPYSYTEPAGGYLAGQMMMAGKLEMQAAAPYNPYGSWQSYAEDEWDLFLVFGDPTMDMRTEVPFELTVAAPYLLPAGSTEATFSVHSPSDEAVEGAMVCMRNETESLYLTGLTDATGDVTFTFPAMSQQSPSYWMVTSHNALPAEGVISGVGTASESGAVIGSIGTPFPNPSSSVITFPLTVDATGDFELVVYDLTGRAVSMVHSGELESGSHSLVWDGTAGGTTAPAGVYLARYTSAGGLTGVHKLILTR